MQIKFVRSGGVAGAATRVEGTVDFKANTVSSPGSGYQRALSATEAERLRCAVDTAVKCHEASAPLHQAAVPDGLQYDVTVAASDGKTHSMTLRPEGPPGPTTLSSDIAGWIQEEAQKIWEHRISQR